MNLLKTMIMKIHQKIIIIVLLIMKMNN